MAATTTRYASEGAVRQDGPLPIRECNRCHSDIVWATSRSTGKHYPVDVFTGQSSGAFYIKKAFHSKTCAERTANFEAYRAQLIADEARNASHGPQIAPGS
jgi:hypothetical protein